MYYIVAKLLPGAVGMITTALLTRLLNPTRYGLYGLALVVMTFGSTMVFDWLGVSFLRFYERRRGDPMVFSTVIQIFLALVLLSGVATAIAWACGLFAGSDAAIVGVGILMMWSFSWFELAGRFEIANFRPAYYVRMNLGRALFIVIGAGSAAWATHSPVWTAVGTAAGTAAGALIGGFKRWSIGPSHFDRDLARSLLMFGLPMAASMALGSLVSSGTRTLLEVMDSAEALGLYTACFMLVQNTLTVTSGGIASAAYQLAVRAVESGDPDAAHRQLTENGTLLVAVLAPAALGMALTAHGIATTMVGAKFVAGVTTITPWMAAAALLTNLRAHHLDHAFQLGRRPSLQIAVTAVAAVVAIGLSLVLIPRYGPVGAAMASTVAMGIACVHAVIAGKAAFPLPIPVSGCVRVALACAVMAAVVLCIPERGVGWFIAQVFAGGASYAAAALALDVLGLRRALWQRMRRATPGLRARLSRQGG
jgi:O-antigen/teichoic acid export membrane protein